MNNPDVYLILTVISAVCCVVCLVCVLAPRIKLKPGRGAAGFWDLAAKGVEGADKLTDALRAVFPLSLPLTVADKIIDYAKMGVRKAEQLYNTEEIAKDSRKENATSFVVQALDLAQVEITPEIRQLIDGSIEAAVYAMKHAAQVQGETNH